MAGVLNKALQAILQALNKVPEDVGALKNIPANDPVNMGKLKKLDEELESYSIEARGKGEIDKNEHLDLGAFDFGWENYEDIPDIFKYDNPIHLPTAKNARVNFIRQYDEAENIRKYGPPPEPIDPDFYKLPHVAAAKASKDPRKLEYAFGPARSFYRKWKKEKDMTLNDILGINPDKLVEDISKLNMTGKEYLEKQAKVLYWKDQGFDMETIKDLIKDD
tara:strand:+ start:1808 stop:2467 length:660 start_codon:yes stop_codon:yes gene_type:complete